MSEAQIEKEIQDKGLNAPRLNPPLIDSKIEKVNFHVFEGSCLTVCCMTLVNGFTVTGESACASPENFNSDIGEKIAYEQARNKVWMLEGYLLKQSLFDESCRPELDFQGRVKLEVQELSKRVEALTAFTESELFKSLDIHEQHRLNIQLLIMNDYEDVLNERIAKF
jgi:hypothetical protein